MKTLARLFLYSLVCLLTYSCRTDFDVVASYKEIAIVYGLINPSDSAHYLRITKAFLGEGNSLVYAKIPDSSSYGTDIDVKINARGKNGDQRTITFDTITITNKDTGIFFAPNQLMYTSNQKLYAGDTCFLEIRNKKTGNQVSSSTLLIDNFGYSSLVSPKPFAKTFGYSREVNKPQTVEWKSADNGKLYQLEIRFYFKEVLTNNDSINRVVQWAFDPVKSQGIRSGENVSISMMPEDFYVLCGNNIPYADLSMEDRVERRLADHFDLIITLAGDEFNTYMEVNGPSTGLLIEKPSYSNINNGVGMFSCRYQFSWNYGVNDITKADLQAFTYTDSENHQRSLMFFAD